MKRTGPSQTATNMRAAMESMGHFIQTRSRNYNLRLFPFIIKLVGSSIFGLGLSLGELIEQVVSSR